MAPKILPTPSRPTTPSVQLPDPVVPTSGVLPAGDLKPRSEQAIPPADPNTLGVTADDIRQLAYRKWEEAGRPEGDGTEFWLQAERELKHAFLD